MRPPARNSLEDRADRSGRDVRAAPGRDASASPPRGRSAWLVAGGRWFRLAHARLPVDSGKDSTCAPCSPRSLPAVAQRRVPAVLGRRAERAPPWRTASGRPARSLQRRPGDLPRPQRRRTLLQQAQELARHRDEERQDRPQLPRRDLPRRDPSLDQKRPSQHVLAERQLVISGCPRPLRTDGLRKRIGDRSPEDYREDLVFDVQLEAFRRVSQRPLRTGSCRAEY
jgi:hypothetical protein